MTQSILAQTSVDVPPPAPQEVPSSADSSADATSTPTIADPATAPSSATDASAIAPADATAEAPTTGSLEQPTPAQPADSISAPPLDADGGVATGDAKPAEGQTTEAVPVDGLVALDQDQGVFWMGVLPIIGLGLFIVLWIAIAYWRQKKNWQELGKDLELSEDPAPSQAEEPFLTGASMHLSDAPESIPAKPTGKKTKGYDDDEDV